MSIKSKIIFWILIAVIFIMGMVLTACNYFLTKSINLPSINNSPLANTNKVPDSGCTDKCGDGICQEIVCLAIGCPCAESSALCPQDCLNSSKVIYKTEEIKEDKPDYTIDFKYPVFSITKADKATVINNKIKELSDNEIILKSFIPMPVHPEKYSLFDNSFF